MACRRCPTKGHYSGGNYTCWLVTNALGNAFHVFVGPRTEEFYSPSGSDDQAIYRQPILVCPAHPTSLHQVAGVSRRATPAECQEALAILCQSHPEVLDEVQGGMP